MTRRHPRWTLGAIALLLLCGANVTWGQGSRSLPEEVVLDRYGLARRWHAQVPMMKLREQLTTIKVDQGLLFAQTNQGAIHCLDAESGQRHWSYAASHSASEVYQPAITKDYVFVVSATSVIQLNRKTGLLIRRQELPATGSAGPASNNKYLYVPTVDSRIYCFDLKPATERKFGNGWPITWFYHADGVIRNPPIIIRDRLVFVTSVGTLYASHLDKRNMMYRFYTKAANDAPVAHLDRMLYLPSADFNLYAIDTFSGTGKWRFASGYPINSKPVPFLEEVFVTPEQIGLFCLDNETGDVFWHNERIKHVLAVSQQHVFGSDRHHHLTILSRDDGHIIGTVPTANFTVSPDNQYNDRVYLGTTDGLIVCMHEKASPTPFIHPQSTKPAQKGAEAEAEMTEEKAEDEPAPKKKRRGFFGDDAEEKEEMTKDDADSTEEKAEPKDGDAEEKAPKKASKKSFFEE